MRADVASRVIAAPPDRVFRAFTDPVVLTSWLPPEGMTGQLERFDASPGGGFRMRLIYDKAPEGGGKSGEDSDLTEVAFVEIDPPHRLVQQAEFVSDDPRMAGTMTMTWRFEPRGGGTQVMVRATGVPEGISAEDHVMGMASSLANLARALE
ncbi:ATPase [Microbacterium sp. Root61]|uniref:SRPBCC family protein n=1 Tax=Microbacterium sp. Root61 TaxID=1736570 RepID=UPI0006F1E925|nr:SRPBCC family protein [Microbacterium sp. Root61]KRA24949.1 ATPase [Microbacterium sp. Root61]